MNPFRLRLPGPLLALLCFLLAASLVQYLAQRLHSTRQFQGAITIYHQVVFKRP